MATRRELWWAATAVAVLTIAYLIVVSQVGVPAASGLFGHGLGIAGFILMLMTETMVTDFNQEDKKKRLVEGSIR